METQGDGRTQSFIFSLYVPQSKDSGAPDGRGLFRASRDKDLCRRRSSLHFPNHVSCGFPNCRLAHKCPQAIASSQGVPREHCGFAVQE